MTETIISLLSIVFGIVGANLTGVISKRHTFGITGNTIAGVFGSVLFIKSVGRLGFDPMSIIQSGSLNGTLFIINAIASMVGGVVAVIIAKMVKNKMNKY